MSVGSIAVDVIGTTSLSLTFANGYDIDGIGPGAKSFRRNTVQSPYVPGRFITDIVADYQTAVLDVWVGGSSGSQLQTRVGTLLTAFEQFTYTLQVVIDGATYSWTCEPADSAVGQAGAFEEWDLGAFGQEVHLTIPRSPIPVAGPL